MTNRIPLIVNAGAAQIQELAAADTLQVPGTLAANVVQTDNYQYANGAPFAGGGSGNYGNANVTALFNTGFSGNLIPAANNVYSIGALDAQWSSVYISANTMYFNGVPLSVGNSGNIPNVLFFNSEPIVVSSNTAPPATANITTTAAVEAGNVVISNTTPGGGIVFADGTVQTSAAGAGAQGTTGAQGTQGTTGTAGAQGTTGTTGTQGATGVDGPQGTTGVDGPQGTTGTQGATGSTGLQGTTGDVGAQGTTGAQGGTGAATTIIGSTALTSGNEQAELNAAFPGAVNGDGAIDSNTGDLWVLASGTWNNVGNIVGPQGATGADGAQGTTGSTGLQGTTGVDGAQGTTGTQGTTGAQGIQGIGSDYGNANVSAYLASGLDTAGYGTAGDVAANVFVASSSFSSLGDGTILGNLSVGGTTSLGNIGNVFITGGLAGEVIITDGAGNLSFIPLSNTSVSVIPAVHFTAAANGNAQTFSNVVLGGYTANTDMTVFRNGALLENTYYSLSGDVLTVNVNLTVGDNIDIITQFAGNLNNVSSGYGDSNVSAYLSSGADTAGISTTGNISGLYIIGDGSQLTGLPASYSDANVQTLLSSGNLTGNIVTLGNVQAGAFIGDGSFLSGMYGDPNVETLLGNVATSVIPSTANIYTLGNASNPFGTTYTTTLILGTTGLSLTGNNITTTGDTIYIDPLNDGTPAGNVIILGDLQVAGNLTYADAISATTANLLWIAANDANTASLASGAGLGIGANAEYASFTFNSVSNTWNASLPVISANFIGDGSLLTDITGANITGIVAQANVAATATTAATVTTNAQPNITSVGTLGSLAVTGNILAGNVQTTELNATNLGGTLTTAAQPNITSVGTLDSLSVANSATISGNLSAGNVIASTLAGSLTTNAQPNVTSVGTLTSLTATGNITITGSSGEYVISTNNNHGGANYAGIMTMTNSNPGVTNPNKFLRLNPQGNLEIVNSDYSQVIFAIQDSGNLNATGNISAPYFLGDGSQLTGITALGNSQISNYLASGTNSANIVTTGNVVGTTVYANSANAIVVGSAATSAVAMNVPNEAAIRNYGNNTVNNSMYFDVNVGGTNDGQFRFRGTSSFTEYAIIGAAGIQSQTSYVGKLGFSPQDTELTVDNYRFRITTGNVPQIISNTGGTVNSAWTNVANLFGGSLSNLQGTNGLLIPNNSWTSVYTNAGINNAGDNIVTTLLDKSNNRQYRVTWTRNDSAFAILVERLF